MSVFTNASSSAKEQAARYITAVLGLVGDREPFEILHWTPDAVSQVVSDLSGDRLVAPEAAGKWSIRDVVQHLADSELVWGWRIRLVLAQDEPPLTGYDQDRWADRLHYDQADAVTAAAEFAVLRAANLRLLEAASPAELERVGLHVERGRESLTHMIRLYAGHDILHLNQIARIQAAIGG